MQRQRIHDEVIEIMCQKLARLPLPTEEPLFDYDSQIICPNVTRNDLDIAELTMDLEDAFGVVLEKEPGSEELPTIGSVSDYIASLLAEKKTED